MASLVYPKWVLEDPAFVAMRSASATPKPAMPESFRTPGLNPHASDFAAEKRWDSSPEVLAWKAERNAAKDAWFASPTLAKWHETPEFKTWLKGVNTANAASAKQPVYGSSTSLAGGGVAPGVNLVTNKDEFDFNSWAQEQKASQGSWTPEVNPRWRTASSEDYLGLKDPGRVYTMPSQYGLGSGQFTPVDNIVFKPKEPSGIDKVIGAAGPILGMMSGNPMFAAGAGAISSKSRGGSLLEGAIQGGVSAALPGVLKNTFNLSPPVAAGVTGAAKTAFGGGDLSDVLKSGTLGYGIPTVGKDFLGLTPGSPAYSAYSGAAKALASGQDLSGSLTSAAMGAAVPFAGSLFNSSLSGSGTASDGEMSSADYWNSVGLPHPDAGTFDGVDLTQYTNGGGAMGWEDIFGGGDDPISSGDYWSSVGLGAPDTTGYDPAFGNFDPYEDMSSADYWTQAGMPGQAPIVAPGVDLSAYGSPSTSGGNAAINAAKQFLGIPAGQATTLPSLLDSLIKIGAPAALIAGLFEDNESPLTGTLLNAAKSAYSSAGKFANMSPVGMQPSSQSAIDLANTNTGAWQPYIDKAAAYTDQAAGGIPSIDLATYMNPYMADQTRNIEEYAQKRRQQMKHLSDISGNDTYIPGGANLTRYGVESSGIDLDAMRAISEARAGAFNRATDLAATDLNRKGQAGGAFNTFANTVGTQGARDFATLGAAGELEAKPLENALSKASDTAKLYTSIIPGTASAVTETRPPSTLGQAVGAFGAYNAANKAGWFG